MRWDAVPEVMVQIHIWPCLTDAFARLDSMCVTLSSDRRFLKRYPKFPDKNNLLRAAVRHKQYALVEYLLDEEVGKKGVDSWVRRGEVALGGSARPMGQDSRREGSHGAGRQDTRFPSEWRSVLHAMHAWNAGVIPCGGDARKGGRQPGVERVSAVR